MECVRRCEFQEFDGNNFECSLYDEELKTSYSDIYEKVYVIRCKQCIDEGTIGSNTKDEYVRKFKQHLGWMADNFYSFKDDFETELTHLYRLIKELEEDETVSLSEVTGDHKREPDEIFEEV